MDTRSCAHCGQYFFSFIGEKHCSIACWLCHKEWGARASEDMRESQRANPRDARDGARRE